MQFSSTCKRYTDVMALKNQLQCHVFNSQLTSDTASHLTQLIINLQTAAVKLQIIEVSNFYKWSYNVIIAKPLHLYYSMSLLLLQKESGSSCVEFTATQYYHIYQSRFEEGVVDKSLKGRSYVHIGNITKQLLCVGTIWVKLMEKTLVKFSDVQQNYSMIFNLLNLFCTIFNRSNHSLISWNN